MRRAPGLRLAERAATAFLLLAVTAGCIHSSASETSTSSATGSSTDRALRTVADFRGLVADLTAFWSSVYPAEVRTGPALALLRGSGSTGCGRATLDEGTFYCEDNRTIYVQQADLDEIRDKPEVQQQPALVYLIAHEYGHFLQIREDVPDPPDGTGPASGSVRYEQQADCLAGVFVATLPDSHEEGYAAVVRENGDDQGPEPALPRDYDHGTGAQRVTAFTRGLRGGAETCLTG